MEIARRSKNLITIMKIICWVIFVGLCVEAGGFIVNAVLTHFLNGEEANKLWQQANLSGLYQFEAGHFTAMSIIICLVAIMKAILFYLIIKILSNKDFNIQQPFNLEMLRFMNRVAYLALAIGVFARAGVEYAEWLSDKGILLPEISKMGIAGADVWLFMGLTLIVITQIFKRGMEIQLENELTV